MSKNVQQGNKSDEVKLLQKWAEGNNRNIRLLELALTKSKKNCGKQPLI